jgi:hypothetical protein
MKFSVALVALGLLAACAGGQTRKDYDAMRACHDQGFQTDTEGFNRCVEEERAARALKEQRQEFEQMKQYDRDWKMRRY